MAVKLYHLIKIQLVFTTPVLAQIWAVWGTKNYLQLIEQYILSLNQDWS